MSPGAQLPPADPPRKDLTGARRWEGILPSFSLGRRVTVLVLLATVLVVGVVAAVGIPLETFPRGFENPFLQVVVPWQDAPPQEVLEKIVIPLEDELATVRGIDRMSSLARTGMGFAFMRFKQGTDMDVAYREVRDRVQRVKPQLPEDADRVLVQKFDLADFPVYMVGLAVDPALTDFYNLIQNQVVLPLERIDGVASVNPAGLEEKEILIEVDRAKAESAGLNIFALAQDLQGDNFTLASGNVRSGASKLLLRSVARYAGEEDLRRRLVAPSVRLGDIAEIKYEEPEKDYSARVNRRPAVAVQVFKEGEVNTLEVCERIEAAVEKMQKDPRLGDIEILPIFDQGQIIRSSLSTMIGSGRIGALFAVLVLFFFLRRLRMTLIIALAIPLSLLIGLTAMYFSGETLNILTLLALMISVGLLVDNSVVVAENIHRLHRQGASRRDAAVRGAGEIALAIVMATATTIAVFLPMSLLDGAAQFFLLRLSIPISVSLVGSLVVALVFVPLAAYLTLPRRGAEKARPSAWRRTYQRVVGVFNTAYHRTLEPVNEAYNRMLAVFLRRRAHLAVGITLVFLITAFGVFPQVKFAFQQESERTNFEFSFRLPKANTLSDTSLYFRGVEDFFEANRETWDLGGFYIEHRRSRGNMQAWFNSPRTNDISPRVVLDAMLEGMPESPGVEVFSSEQSRVSECTEKGVYCLRLYAEDHEELARVREDLEQILRQVPGVTGVKKSSEESPNQLALVLDRERLQRQDINPQAVAGVVGYALRGQSLPKFYRDGNEIPVRVRFREENRESLAELQDFSVPTNQGDEVALATLAEVSFRPAEPTIFRRDKRVSRTISLELAQDTEEETTERLDAMTASMDLPEGVSFGAPTAITDDGGFQGLVFAALMSMVFIYLLMAFLFESFVLPLSIILTIPLASIGVGWVHLLTGFSLDFLGGVAGVLLIGVVVNNGIVLIDYVIRLRDEGHRRTEALLMAASRRFRPIMMTALTTICATAPLTVGGTTETGFSYTSFGLSLIGGMTTATLLTLLVVPVFYSLFDDVRESARGALQRARNAWRREDPESPSDASPQPV